mgnify:CR=1 FL=1|tara:strand:- start:9029 stop:9442 length:414 start_codon:yes stop_codon:yes gene_type:complete
MTVYDYCAIKNPSGTAKVIASFGMRPVKDKRELAEQLKFLAKRNGGEVLRRIVLIHPDRSLFEHERKLKAEKEQKMLSASGPETTTTKELTEREKENLVQADKDRESKKEHDSKILTQNNMIIGGVVILGLAIIMKK